MEWNIWLKMNQHTMHSPINVLNLWVKLENCRKHDISTIVIVMWFSLNFPITYFVSNFTSVSNRIGPLCFGDTSNLQGLLRAFMEQASLFCMLRSPKSLHFMPCSWYLWKTLDEKGCNKLVWDCLELRCGSYWLMNHFFNEN